MSLHVPIRNALSVPPISIRAIEPSDALLAAYMSDDPTEFYRLIAEREAHDSEIAAELARAEGRAF